MLKLQMVKIELKYVVKMSQDFKKCGFCAKIALTESQFKGLLRALLFETAPLYWSILINFKFIN